MIRHNIVHAPAVVNTKSIQIIFLTMYTQSERVWYFAYGSNMSKEKFIGRRGIVPLASARVYLPNWVLSMEIPGVPYSEPSYGSIHMRTRDEAEHVKQPDVLGVAYSITPEQYQRVIASEGGQIAYQDMSLAAIPFSREDEDKTGALVMVRTLCSTVMIRHPSPTPSNRYMDLLMTGAKDAALPLSYQKYLAQIPCYSAPTNRWTKLGAFIFLSLVNPVWRLLDKITHLSTGTDGNVPEHVVWLVRTVIRMIWFLHDYVFAPVFGRGDGLELARSQGCWEGKEVWGGKTRLVAATYFKHDRVTI